MAFFKLIRWPNLLMIALVQYLIRLAVIESLNVPHILTHLQFFLGVLCSISLAAAGYVINDLHDLEADRKNKPHRMVIGLVYSEKQAWTIYFILTLIAVISGYVVAEASGFDNLWLVAPIATVLLYLYAVDLKRRAVIGNLIVSLLVAMPVLLVAVFDVLPAAGTENDPLIGSVFRVILGYAGFAFFTNFIRELVKDAEDIEGDRAAGYQTLAVIMGTEYLRILILVLMFVLLIFTGAYNLFLFENKANLVSSLYVLVLVNLPILVISWLLINARSKSHFKRAGNLLKLLMLTGMFSMLVFTLAIKAMAA